MPLSRALIRDNPWWADPGAIEHDAHLQRLRERGPTFEHRRPFRLDADAVYTLRGPRQVGKTTLLKKIILDLLEGDDPIPSRRVMYLDVQGAGLGSSRELQEELVEYLSWARTSEREGRLYVFLDEVTGIESWGTAIRALHGRGSLKAVTLLATGSHALDVKRGGETMPGRRGDVEHPDWIMMPLAFRDHVRLIGSEPLPPLPEFDLSDPSQVFATAREYELRRTTIQPLFDRYLLTGGYPHAIHMEVAEGKIPSHVYRLYQQAIVGEMRRAGHREDLFRELALWFAYHFPGREFSWRDVSGQTDIGSKDTAREIIENAQAAFVWHVLFRVRTLGKPQEAPRSPKKLYTVDPLTWHLLRSWALGHADPWEDSLRQQSEPEILGRLVESIVADHLRRRFGRFVFYYRTSRGREEIDFVIQKGTVEPTLLEVKYGDRLRSSDRKWLAKHGGGILVGRTDLAWHEEDNVAEIPAATFLMGVGDSLTLFPSPG